MRATSSAIRIRIRALASHPLRPSSGCRMERPSSSRTSEEQAIARRGRLTMRATSSAFRIRTAVGASRQSSGCRTERPSSSRTREDRDLASRTRSTMRATSSAGRIRRRRAPPARRQSTWAMTLLGFALVETPRRLTKAAALRARDTAGKNSPFRLNIQISIGKKICA